MLVNDVCEISRLISVRLNHIALAYANVIYVYLFTRQCRDIFIKSTAGPTYALLAFALW